MEQEILAMIDEMTVQNECTLDGVMFSQMRICNMHSGKEKIMFGIYACSPEESSFQARFSKMQVMQILSLPTTPRSVILTKI